MKTAKKMISTMLAFVMLATCVPTSAFAQEMIHSFNSIEGLFEEELLTSKLGTTVSGMKYANSDNPANKLWSYRTPDPVEVVDVGGSTGYWFYPELKGEDGIVVLGKKPYDYKFYSREEFNKLYEHVNGHYYQLKNVSLEDGIVLEKDVIIAGQRYKAGTLFRKVEGKWESENAGEVVSRTVASTAVTRPATASFSSVAEFFEPTPMYNSNGNGTLPSFKGKEYVTSVNAQPVEAHYLTTNDLNRFYDHYLSQGEGYLIQIYDNEGKVIGERFLPYKKFEELYTEIPEGRGILFKSNAEAAYKLETEVVIAGKTYPVGTVFEKIGKKWQVSELPTSYKTVTEMSVVYRETMSKMGKFVTKLVKRFKLNPRILETAFFKKIATPTIKVAEKTGSKAARRIFTIGAISVLTYAAITLLTESEVYAAEIPTVSNDDTIETIGAALKDFDKLSEGEKMRLFLSLSQNKQAQEAFRNVITKTPKLWEALCAAGFNLDNINEDDLMNDIQNENNKVEAEDARRNLIEGYFNTDPNFDWQNPNRFVRWNNK